MDLYAHLYEFGWADKTKGIDDAGAQFDKARVSLKSNGFNASEVPDKQLLTSILLPIELIDFAVEQVGEELNITWATAAEVNNDFFTLEYSFDGVQFEPLEIVSGAGTSSTCHEYGVWVLAEQFSGVTYFRLKQTDFDGSESYSNVVVYNVMAQNELFAVYPNPAVTEIHVSGNYELVQCVDVRNCKVALPKIEENVYSVVHLSAGNYVLILQTLHGKKAVQFVKR